MSGSGDALVTRLYLGLALVLGLVVTSAGADHAAFTDLEGHVINATIVRNQVVRREGRQASIQVNQQWKIVIGPGESIETTVASTVQTPRGQRKSKPRTGTLILGETRPIRSQGGGHGMWQFEDGTLTFVRTYKQGAYRGNFALARGADGLTCTVTESFGREGSRGAIVMESAVDGKLFAVISSKQVSSTCRVAKPSPPGALN